VTMEDSPTWAILEEGGYRYVNNFGSLVGERSKFD